MSDQTTKQDSGLPKQEKHPLEECLEVFIGNVFRIRTAYAVLMPHTIQWIQKEYEENNKKIEKYKIPGENGRKKFQANNAHEITELMSTLRHLDKLDGMKISETLQKSLFIQIFSEYDAFTGALLTVLYKKKPALLGEISKEIKFCDILKYSTIDAIKLDILEKEIENLRRESLTDQFCKMENKFRVQSLRKFKEWATLVEMNQRRNLIVHNDGRVSDQYIMICEREGYHFPETPQLGSRLKLEHEYFLNAINVVTKVAFMLTHTLWRKLFPEESDAAHNSANATIFEILKDRRWTLASSISEFSLANPMTKDISDIDHRIRVINAAIGEKFSDKNDECEKVLNTLDWSASNRDFKMAALILKDKFKEAATLMRSIGKDGELIQETSYHSWPLFHKFREQPEFLAAYEEIYQTKFKQEIPTSQNENGRVTSSSASDTAASDQALSASS